MFTYENIFIDIDTSLSLPTIHIIDYQQLTPIYPFISIGQLEGVNILELRNELLCRLTNIFQGDKLVAEYFLLYSISGIYKQVGELKLGNFNLNIFDIKDVATIHNIITVKTY